MYTLQILNSLHYSAVQYTDHVRFCVPYSNNGISAGRI